MPFNAQVSPSPKVERVALDALSGAAPQPGAPRAARSTSITFTP